ncbi:MAG: hypothetical protein L0210_00530 [Rhodospirillales bacterium]|nr:hypothetical protein [Rhodospirillales bacterium]
MQNRLLKLLRAVSLGTAGLIATGSAGMTASLEEVAAYEAAIESGSLAAFAKFLERFPTGPLSERILQIVHDRLPREDPLAAQIASTVETASDEQARELALDVSRELQSRADQPY